MIRIEGLVRHFGHGAAAVAAVDGVGFEAGNGCITGLLGSNGAGKTTTVRLLAGLLRPQAGRIEVDGIDAVAQPTSALSRLAVLSDARGLYPRLTARENIVYFGRLQGLSPERAESQARSLARGMGFEALLDRRCAGFSQGERIKVALARSMVHDPQNLVLDEPGNGLDVVANRALREVLRGLRDAGKCIVLSTHVMQEVQRLCDRVVVLSRGRVVAQGSVESLCEAAGTADFEAAFVRLAFGSELPASIAAAGGGGAA